MPLPEQAEGSKGVIRLLDWLVFEFEGLGEVVGIAGDNVASLTFEGLLGNLLWAGSMDLSRLEGDFQFVPYDGLSDEVSKIQDVKAAFFERFWYPSGRDAVRALAAAAAEVSVFLMLFIYC